MKYEINGPFELKRKRGNKLPDFSSQAKKEFWNNVNDVDTNIRNSCGIYIFSMKAGKGKKPWYVGKAEKQSFENEIFTPHKRAIYQDVVAGKKGTPIFILISQMTKSNKYAKPTKNKNKAISFLENSMISSCLDKNPNLANIHKTKYLKNLIVPGFLNTPKRKHSREENEFISIIR
jgi:hypothetical protein